MKKKILKSIETLTQLQGEAIEAEDFEKLEELLKQRQEQMNALDALHTGQPSYEEEEQALLKQIQEKDRANRENYEIAYNHIKHKLNQLRSAKKAKDVYTNPYSIAKEEGIFFDRGR